MACCFDITDGVPRSEPTRVSLYAQNETGLQRLMFLSSRSFLDAPDGIPKLHRRLLLEDTDGLILLTGGAEGEVARHIQKGRTGDARTELSTLAAAYPGRCYVEITRHGTQAEIKSEPGLLELAYDLQLPIVATHDARFMKPDDATAHDALMCIANGQYLGQDDRKRVEPTQFLQSPQEMADLFADLPEAIAATFEIAKRCAVRAEMRNPILPGFSAGGLSEPEELRKQALEGLALRMEEADQLYADRQVYFDRLDFELGVIERMGFPGYFLIVSDFIKWAKSNGIPVGPGRGSGAGSLVAWSLLITNIDPIKYNLLFERFLNPERVSMPDIDIDFCIEGRENVIQYIRDKYGHEKVGQIITFGTMMAKGVIKDVARVLGFPFEDANSLTELIPEQLKISLKEALEQEPKLQQLIDSNPKLDRLFDIARKLEGLTRHASKHAAGIVISPEPIDHVLPVYVPPKSTELVTQYAMTELETIGFLKIDLLGLKNLTLIRNVLDSVYKNHQIKIDIDHIPLDDKKTFDLICAGKTSGVFQLESEGLKDVLTRLKPEKFEDIIAVNALYRPGPLGSGMVDDFIERKHGRQKIHYLFDELEPILKETYGVIVYQEQVMKIASAIGG